MGLRRLRARLDGLESHGHQTMYDAQTLIKMGQDFVADLEDGFGITVQIDEGAARKLLSILAGNAGELPIRVKIDPTVDA